MLAQAITDRLPIVPTGIMVMRLMTAHLTVTTAQIILPGECSLARGHGSIASTAGATTVAGGASTGVAGTVTMTDSAANVDGAVKADGVVKADGMAVAGSTGIKDSMVVEAFMAVEVSNMAASAAVTVFMVAVEAFTEAEAAGPTGEVAFTVAVADPTGEAIDNCWNILLTQSNGWQSILPAVLCH